MTTQSTRSWTVRGTGRNAPPSALPCSRSTSCFSGQAPPTSWPIGFVPTSTALNVEGLDVSAADMAELLTVHDEEWRHEVPRIHEHFAEFGEHLPAKLHAEVKRLEATLGMETFVR